MIGVVERNASVFRQFQAAARFAKQGSPQLRFKQLDLPRERLRSGVQLLASAHDATRLGRCPKLVKMLEIHLFDLYEVILLIIRIYTKYRIA